MEKNIRSKVVGNGDFLYELDKNWGELDHTQHPVENCHDFAIDKAGRIYMVTDDVRNNVLVYSKEGELLDAWGTEYPGLHAIEIVEEEGEEYIFLVDSGWKLNRRWDGVSTDVWDSPFNKVIPQSGFVAKLTLTGELVFTIGHPQTFGAYEPVMPFNPTDIAVADNGDFFVTDGYGSDFVLHFNNRGVFQNRFGGHDNADENSNLVNAHGIAVDRRGEKPTLMISSRAQQCLKVFDFNGTYIKTIDTKGAWIHGPVFMEEGYVAAACWSHIDNQNVDNSGFLCIFDKDDKIVATIGAEAPSYIDGKLQLLRTDWSLFKHAHGVTVDDEGNLYVGEWRAEQSYPMKLKRVRS